MKAPELLKEIMPAIRAIENKLVSLGYIKGTDEFNEVFSSSWKFYLKFGMI